jgi:hypothetical protein
LKRDKDPTIAISAISTGALAASACLRFIFKSREKAPNRMPTNVNNLRQLINAPWQDAESFSECHLLVLYGFVSGLLHHLSSDDDIDPTSFRTVWETLPWILNMAPLKYSNIRFMEPFLALGAGLEQLSGTERATDADESPIKFRTVLVVRKVLLATRLIACVKCVTNMKANSGPDIGWRPRISLARGCKRGCYEFVFIYSIVSFFRFFFTIIGLCSISLRTLLVIRIQYKRPPHLGSTCPKGRA